MERSGGEQGKGNSQLRDPASTTPKSMRLLSVSIGRSRGVFRLKMRSVLLSRSNADRRLEERGLPSSEGHPEFR
jgi:hypothetical protein